MLESHASFRPPTLADCGTSVLEAMDTTLKCKTFWTKQNAKHLAVMATIDLLMSFCLFQASSSRFTLKAQVEQIKSGL